MKLDYVRYGYVPPPPPLSPFFPFCHSFSLLNPSGIGGATPCNQSSAIKRPRKENVRRGYRCIFSVHARTTAVQRPDWFRANGEGVRAYSVELARGTVQESFQLVPDRCPMSLFCPGCRPELSSPPPLHGASDAFTVY